MSDVPDRVGARVSYVVASRAGREAIRRLASASHRSGETSPPDQITLADAVVCATVCGLIAGYSKLSDRVALKTLEEESSYSRRQVRRSLANLDRLQIIEYLPGRGAGNLGVITLPHPEEERGQQPAAFGSPQSEQSPFEDDDRHARKADDCRPLSRTTDEPRRGTGSDEKGDEKGDTPHVRGMSEKWSEKTSEEPPARACFEGETRTQESEGEKKDQERFAEIDDHAADETDRLLAAVERATGEPSSSEAEFLRELDALVGEGVLVPLDDDGGGRTSEPSEASSDTLRLAAEAVWNEAQRGRGSG